MAFRLGEGKSLHVQVVTVLQVSFYTAKLPWHDDDSTGDANEEIKLLIVNQPVSKSNHCGDECKRWK
jgi:hypothetical protein